MAETTLSLSAVSSGLFAVTAGLLAWPGLCFARPAAQDAEPSLVRWYDVRGLLADSAFSEPGIDLRTHISSSRLNALEPDSWDVSLEEPFRLEHEGVDDILRQLLDAAPEAPDFDVELRSGVLRVQGPARVHDDARRILADLSAFAADRVDVRVYRVPSEAWHGVDASVLDAAVVERLLGSSGVSCIGGTEARVGRAVRFGEEGYVSVLYDYDVEVAQGALAADPQVTVLRPGHAVGVQVRRATDGRLLVKAWGRHGAIDEPIREVAHAPFADAPIQVPSMATTLWTASADLVGGGALVVGQDESGNGALLVRVREVDAAARAGATGPAFVHLGELTGKPIGLKPLRLAITQPSGGWSPSDEDWPSWLIEPEPLLEAGEVRDVLEELRDELGLVDRMHFLGDVIYLPDAGPLRDKVRAEVAAMAAEMKALTVDVDVRYALVPEAEVAGLLAQRTEDVLPRMTSRVAGATRLGATLSVVGGHETSYLGDIDVEIAQASAIGDPIESHRFEGVSVWCIALRSPSGALSALLDVSVQRSLAPLRSIPLVAWDPRPLEKVDETPVPSGQLVLRGALDLSETHRAHDRSVVHGEGGEWQRAALQPVGGSGQVLVVLARLRAAP